MKMCEYKRLRSFFTFDPRILLYDNFNFCPEATRPIVTKFYARPSRAEETKQMFQWCRLHDQYDGHSSR